MERSLSHVGYSFWAANKLLFVTKEKWSIKEGSAVSAILIGRVATVVDVSEMDYDKIRATLEPYAKGNR